MRITSKIVFYLYSLFPKKLRGLYVLNAHNLGSDLGMEVVMKNLKWLKKHFDFVHSPDEKIDGNRPCILLTFDDGYDEWIAIGELLAKFKIRAIFFVNGGILHPETSQAVMRRCKSTKLPLSKSDIKSLVKQGHTIGSHSYSHYNLRDLTLTQLHLEVSNDLEQLEALTESRVKFFAWPYGSYHHIHDWQIDYLMTRFDYVMSSGDFRNRRSRKGVINRRHWELYNNRFLLLGALKMIR